MKTSWHASFLAALATALVLSTSASADRIELADGSIVLGKLLSVEGGKFKVETGFAGTIEIAQAQVKTFATDEAVNVAFSAGSTALGKVNPTTSGIAVVAGNGQMSAPAANVTALWRPGADSPDMRAAKEAVEKTRRKWAYEANVAINGRTGVSENFGSSVGLKATLTGEHDKLIFSSAVERATDQGVQTANKQKGGVDYSAFGADSGNGWYLRTDVERDKIKHLALRSNSAFGFARKLRQTDVQDLEARVGASYLFERYSNGGNFDSPGVDLLLLHSYRFAFAKLANSLGYTPSINDLGNYRIRHESSLDLPLAASRWNLRFGVANDYQSVPAANTAKLDTTYFTSLVFRWD